MRLRDTLVGVIVGFVLIAYFGAMAIAFASGPDTLCCSDSIEATCLPSSEPTCLPSSEPIVEEEVDTGTFSDEPFVEEDLTEPFDEPEVDEQIGDATEFTIEDALDELEAMSAENSALRAALDEANARLLAAGLETVEVP